MCGKNTALSRGAECEDPVPGLACLALYPIPCTLYNGTLYPKPYTTAPCTLNPIQRQPILSMCGGDGGGGGGGVERQAAGCGGKGEQRVGGGRG